MKYMLTIFREGSISRAAEVLYVSQPSVSQMVRKVEEELRADLFVRHTNPLVLTPAGECYMQAARAIQSVQQNLDRQLEEIRLGTRGSIRLGMPLQRSLELLPDIFPRFHARYPAVNLKLTESGSDALETMLLNHQLDIACLTTSAKTNPLNYILVSREELVLLASKNTALAGRVEDGTPIDIREAEEEAFISLRSGHSTRITQDRLFADAHISPEILFETESVEVAKHAAGPCQAVFLCPKNYIDISPEVRKTCVVYPVVGVEQGRHFYICHRKDQYLTHYMVELIRLLKPDFELPRSEEFSES
ncbi:MAG: LysR substrate-binding domain-containing protein [Stomatobaculum longum]